MINIDRALYKIKSFSSKKTIIFGQCYEQYVKQYVLENKIIIVTPRLFPETP